MKRLLLLAAALAFGGIGAARADDPPKCDAGKLCICTGSPIGNYQAAGERIGEQLKGGTLHGRLITTNGSLDNLNNAAAGICTGAIAQSDVYEQWKTESSGANNIVPVQDLYTEYVHILCPASAEINNLDGLAKRKATLIIGPPGSGTAETWRSLRQVDTKKYGNENIDVSGEPADSGSVQLVKASNNKQHPVCMLWISGLNSQAMQNANDRSVDPGTGKPTMQLISVDDERMEKLSGSDGPRYTVQMIKPHDGNPAQKTPGFYNHLINNSGWFSSAGIKVLAVKSVFFLNKDFKNKIPRNEYNQLATAIDDASGSLRKQMSPGDR
jgi:TRAP-type uncharacterized transport system substrate-binding protein